MDYSAQDGILDAGCGPGHLLEDIYGVLAPRFENMCACKQLSFSGVHNVHNT